MARNQSIIIASVVLLVLFVEQGYAIKCFECNSHYNQGCELQIVPSNFTVDCSLKRDVDENQKPIQYTFCRKINQIIEFSVNQLPANTRIIRGCGHEDQKEKNSCYKRHGFGGRQIVCACEDKDYCNSSDSLKSQSLIIATIVGVIAYLTH